MLEDYTLTIAFFFPAFLLNRELLMSAVNPDKTKHWAHWTKHWPRPHVHDESLVFLVSLIWNFNWWKYLFIFKK